MGALDEERHHLAAGRKGSVAPPSSNLQRLLAERPPLLLGISPGNPYYYKEENLKWLLEFADRSSDLVGHTPIFYVGPYTVLSSVGSTGGGGWGGGSPPLQGDSKIQNFLRLQGAYGTLSKDGLT